jgi:hypothetical protein
LGVVQKTVTLFESWLKAANYNYKTERCGADMQWACGQRREKRKLSFET